MDSPNTTITDVHGSKLEVWQEQGGAVIADVTDASERTTILHLDASQTLALHRHLSRLVLPVVERAFVYRDGSVCFGSRWADEAEGGVE